MEILIMKSIKSHPQFRTWFTFLIVFNICLILGIFFGLVKPATAAPSTAPQAQVPGYAGSESCKQCHDDIHSEWVSTRHAQAFSASIFQRDWGQAGNDITCLECHTTGYDPASGAYSEEGVTCEACHGPFQTGHPETPLPITPDAELCSTCHKTTTDEWRASVHAQNNIQCQACHNPHSQTPLADSVTALCANCHQDRGSSFTHGTHADSGLECSTCHMYTIPRTEDPILGLVPTGHTFSVGSEACIGCHQDTVHTRDEIVALTGEVQQLTALDADTLQQQVQTQDETIKNLEAQSSIRLYVGLAQGAIVGLITGGAAAWVVSRGIRVVEVKEDD
jgi:predicted CXXCH cytochrome family protein